MMYAVNCHGIAEKIPLSHVDGTCRIQTVNEKTEQKLLWFNPIQEKTGLPIVSQTLIRWRSIGRNTEDALHTLAKSDIEYLYLPEYKTLFTISN